MSAVILLPLCDDLQNIVTGSNVTSPSAQDLNVDANSPYGYSTGLSADGRFYLQFATSLGSSAFTVCSNVFIPSLGNAGVSIIDSGAANSVPGSIFLYARASTGKLAIIYNGTLYNANTSIPLSQYNNIRLVGTGSALKVYLNGTLDLTVTVSYNLSATNYTVGAYFSGVTPYSEGASFYDFAIYNTALNSDDFTPPIQLAGKFSTTFSGFGESDEITYQVAADTRTISDSITGNGTDETLYRFVVGDAFELSVTSGQSAVYTGEIGTVEAINEVTVSMAVAVPDTVGKTQANAESLITGAGLVVGDVTEEYSETVAIGHVISQDPVAGTSVEPGSSVDLVVRLGPESVNLPNYIREKLDDSITAVEALGFTVATPSEAYSIAIPKGRICGQIPNSGEVNLSVEIQFAESLGKTTQTDTLFQHTSAVMHFNGNIVDSLGTLWDDDSDAGAEVTFGATGAAFSLAMQMNPSGADVSRILAISNAAYIPAGRDFCPEVLLYFADIATSNTFRLGFFEAAKSVWYIKVVQVSAPVRETMTPAVYGASLVISSSGAVAGEFESATITFSAETVTHIAFTLHQWRVYSFLNGALIARERCLAAPFETNPGEFAIESGIECNVGGFRLTNGYPRYLSPFDFPSDIFPVNQGRESINGWRYNSVSARANTVTSYTDGETIFRKS